MTVNNGTDENPGPATARPGFWSSYETYIQDFFAKYGQEGELYNL